MDSLISLSSVLLFVYRNATNFWALILYPTTLLNCSIKHHRFADWIKSHDPSICCLLETHFEPKDTFRLKVKGWNTIFHTNGPQKKAGVAILIADRLDFKLKTIVRHRRALYYSKRMYPISGYDNYKYICLQQGSSKMHKPTLNQNKDTYR